MHLADQLATWAPIEHELEQHPWFGSNATVAAHGIAQCVRLGVEAGRYGDAVQRNNILHRLVPALAESSPPRQEPRGVSLLNALRADDVPSARRILTAMTDGGGSWSVPGGLLEHVIRPELMGSEFERVIPITPGIDFVESLLLLLQRVFRIAPSLLQQALAHCDVMVIVDDHDRPATYSFALTHLAGFAFYGRSVLDDPDAAGAILHEATHQKMYVLNYGRSITLDPAAGESPIWVPWHRGYWPISQAVHACHVYLHLLGWKLREAAASAGAEAAPRPQEPGPEVKGGTSAGGSGPADSWLQVQIRNGYLERGTHLAQLLGRQVGPSLSEYGNDLIAWLVACWAELVSLRDPLFTGFSLHPDTPPPPPPDR